MPELVDRLKTALADRYAIEREIGAGGMATVYLAEDRKHDRQVAVKVLRPELAAVLGAERFLREVKVAAQFQHPHILTLIDSGEADGFLYYVMPYVEGESLREKLAREGELPVPDAVKILREVVDALAHAHAKGVVHRDIKPDNVMLSGRHALVTDFGVAKAVSEATGREQLTTAGVALGTPTYMSPEQATADPHVDHRADIYAVGVLGYEMLTGQPPFTGPTPQVVLSAHVTETPEPVTKHRDAVPPELAQIVMKCLAKKAADRWQSADELLTQLEAVTTPSGGMTPMGTAPVAAVSAETALRMTHPVRVAGLFGVAAAVTLMVVYGLMIALGLPDWVFVGAVVLLAIGLPIVLAAGHHERRRAVARVSENYVPTPTGVRRHLTWRKAIAGGGFAFAGLGVVTAGYMAMRALGIGPAGTLITKGILEERDPILLADFGNRTSDPTLGMTLTEALRIDLSQSRAVRLVEPNLVLQTLRRMEVGPNTRLDEQLGQEVAERVGVEAVVVGEIAPVGGGYVLSARLVAVADGATLLAERAEAADEGELLAAIDRLSRALREGIGESLRDVRASPPLDQVTTRSLAALRLYTRAQATQNPRRALPLIEQALALDSTFAMAWRKLSVLIVGSTTRQHEAVSRAYELRERVPLRERYLIEALYYGRVLGDGARARSAYEQLLALYPDDFIALHNLGLRYRGGEHTDHERSIELLRRALEVYPNAGTLYVLAGALVQTGRLDEAEETARRVAAEYPDAPPYQRLLQPAQVSFLRGDFESTLERYRSLDAALRNPGIGKAQGLMYLHWVLALQGRLSEAASYFDQAQQHAAGAKPGFYVQLAAWEGMLDVVVRNDPERGRRRVETALRRFPLDSLPVLERPYWGLSRFYTVLGGVERATALAAQWIEDPELSATGRAGREQNGGYRWALGAVALQEGRLEEAIRELTRASERYGNCITPLRDLAEALERAGRPDSAIVVYQRLLASLEMASGGFGACRLGPDALWRAAILKRLGELYEERIERDNAIEYYNQFVELWENADPELQPQVDDVRGRIARLVREPTGQGTTRQPSDG